MQYFGASQIKRYELSLQNAKDETKTKDDAAGILYSGKMQRHCGFVGGVAQQLKDHSLPPPSPA